MLDQKGLQNLLKGIEAKNNLNVLQLDYLKDIKELTIVRSAGIHLLEHLLAVIRDLNSDIKLNLVTKSDNLKSLQVRYPNIDMIQYEHDGNFETEKLFELLKQYAYHHILILYQNLWGTDYANIEAAVEQFKDKKILFWNKDNQLLSSPNLQLKIANDRLMRALIEWYSVYRNNGGALK